MISNISLDLTYELHLLKKDLWKKQAPLALNLGQTLVHLAEETVELSYLFMMLVMAVCSHLLADSGRELPKMLAMRNSVILILMMIRGQHIAKRLVVLNINSLEGFVNCKCKEK